MIPIKRVGLLACAAALTLTGGSFADTDEATNNDLRARIAELESRLAAVEATEDEAWLTEQRADEVRGLVQDVLADADTRASLLAQGMTAGYDDGAVIASADGNWMLKTNLLMQQRYVINIGNDSPAVAPLDDDRWGFENTRTKFILTGNVVNPQWFYRVDINVGTASLLEIDILEFSESSREGTLNAYIGYDLENGFKILVGSMKNQVLREEMVESQYQLLTERSFVNYLYSTGYVDGVALDYMGDTFHFNTSYNDGANTGQTLWSDADTDFGFSFRGEYLFMGNWGQFDDQTSPSGEESGLMAGFGLFYESGESDTIFDDIDLLVLTGDVSWEFGGGNVFFGIIYHSLDLPLGLPSIDSIGVVVQGGYYLADTWEIFGRYEWSDLDIPTVSDVNLFTIGVNKYFAEHNAKWTTGISVGFDPILGVDAIAGTKFPLSGYSADPAGEDGQVTIRSQLQILF